MKYELVEWLCIDLTLAGLWVLWGLSEARSLIGIEPREVISDQEETHKIPIFKQRKPG